MIVGIGSDVVQIPRVEALLRRFGDRFERYAFTEAEQQAANQRYRSEDVKSKASFYAKRFAAKEACAKALGTGFRNGLSLKHIEVANDDHGKPHLKLSGCASELLAHCGEGSVSPTIHLSLSDDYPVAQAFVVLS